MPRVLAVCDDCGSFFPTYGAEVGGAPYVEVIEATFTVGSDLPAPDCPVCGGTSHVLGGEYSIVGDSLELLQGPERTVSQLERFAKILREARDRDASLDEVKQVLREEAPELSALANLLPQNRSDWYAVIAIILTIIQMLTSFPGNIRDVDIDVDMVINKALEHHQARPPESLQRIPKVGRNEPCPCGSGKKYKKCHGNPVREERPSNH